AELEALRSGISQALQLADLYRFQVEEISSANVMMGEDEELEVERKRLSGGEKLLDSVSQAYDGLYGSRAGLEMIGTAMERLQQAVEFDSQQLAPIHEQMQSAYYQLEDAAFQLRAYRDQLEFDPERLNQVEDRLNVIQGLKRKYGATIEDIIAHFEKISLDLDRLENQDEQMDKLSEQVEQTKQKLETEAAALSQARKEAAAALAKEIETHLRDLNMERTAFTVHFETADYSRTGMDRVEFLISANPGEPPRPIHKIA